MTDEAGYVYRERVQPDPAAPLLVVFHGTGGNENQFFDLGQHLLPGARLVAPRGDVSEHGALRYFRRQGEGVFDMQDLALRTAKMAGFIRKMIGPTRPARVVGLGYSNGANILASVMFTAPELFDTAILMHPLIPFDPAPQPGLAGRRALVTAGRRDPIAPAAATERLLAYLGAQGAQVEALWHEGGHELRGEEIDAAQGFLGGAGAAA